MFKSWFFYRSAVRVFKTQQFTTAEDVLNAIKQDFVTIGWSGYQTAGVSGQVNGRCCELTYIYGPYERNAANSRFYGEVMESSEGCELRGVYQTTPWLMLFFGFAALFFLLFFGVLGMQLLHRIMAGQSYALMLVMMGIALVLLFFFWGFNYIGRDTGLAKERLIDRYLETKLQCKMIVLEGRESL